MTGQAPRGIKAWLQHAQMVPLPILKTSVRSLNQLIKEGAALADMVETIERDPALCLHLFLAANKASHALNPTLNIDILSLNHVLSTLGLQGVVNVVRALPALKVRPGNAYQTAYLQAQFNSLYAAQLAASWAEQAKAGDADKIKWSTLMSGAPSWVLWRGAYEQMRHLEWFRYRQNISRRQAEAKLFGCYVEDINRMLGRHFGLPKLSQQALESKEQPSLRQWAFILHTRHRDWFDRDVALRQLKRKPAVLMALANALVLGTTLGWYRRHGLRIEKALSHMLGLSKADFAKQTHQQAVLFSDRFPAPYVVLPAQSLLWPAQGLPILHRPLRCLDAQWVSQAQPKPAVVIPPQPAKTPKIQTTEPVATEEVKPRAVNDNLLGTLIHRFKTQAASFSDVHEILLTCNQAINEGLGMLHTVIFVAGKTGSSLRPVYCVGIAQNSPVRAMTVELSENRFFARLMQKSGAMRIDTDNYRQAKSMLSDEVRKTLGNQNFMAMSLFANQKAVGVVYADTTTGEAMISDKEYAAFKQICQAASLALDSYAKRRKK